MTTLDYARDRPEFWRRWVLLLANITLAYPFATLSLYYLEWACAWYLLEHRPVAMLDDPSGIAGVGILHVIVSCLLMGSLPVWLAGAIANPVLVYERRDPTIAGLARVLNNLFSTIL